MIKVSRRPSAACSPAVALAALLLVLTALLMPTVARAETVRMEAPEEANEWFYSDRNPYYRESGLAPKPEKVDGEYVLGNCTWYAWGRASEMAGEAIEIGTFDPLGMWISVNAAQTYATGSTPRVGALCIGYSSGSSAHVSVVERVVNGKAYVSESGYRTSATWPGYDAINFHYGPVDSWMTGGIVGYIYVLGGEDPTEREDSELESDAWERIFGKDAYDTMSAVIRADDVFEDGRGGIAIVATGDGYWDALAASGLAGLLDAPVIITPRGHLASQARDELERLDPQEVLVLGGSAAVSPETVEEIEDLGIEVERISGADASQTAIEIYRLGNDLVGWGDTAIVATSGGYWDSLSIAPYAFVDSAPIFLTSGADGLLPEAALSEIALGGFTRVIIVGGRAAVGEEVEAQLSSIAVDAIVRLSGKDALATSAKIARFELDEAGMGVEHLAVATSSGYWDALTAAPVAGKTNSVLVLVGKDGGYEAFEEACESGLVQHGHVLGGRAALSRDVWNTIVSW